MSKRTADACKTERNYLEARKKLDEFFEELERNPYAGCPEGFDADAVEVKNAFLGMNCCKREIVVLTRQIEVLLKQVGDIMLELMENPCAEDEICMGVIEKLQLEVNILHDRVTNNEWDIEFYQWWIDEVKNGNYQVLDGEKGADLYDPR